MQYFAFRVSLSAGLLTLLCAGCGKSGPERFELQGAVTYQGKPIPAGYMVFAPEDKAAPGSQADIKQGRYSTYTGRGIVGGPHVVTISGYDGASGKDAPGGNPMGRPLFEDMQLLVDLPKESTTYDFEIPSGKGR